MLKITVGAVVLSLCLPLLAVAEDTDIMHAKHKLLLQINSADETTHDIALNNAVNAQELLGMDNVAIEVVVYGPGMSLLTGKSSHSARVTSLAMQNVKFSACQKTLDKMAQKADGKMPSLVEGTTTVAAGVVRIMALQEAGYAYVKP
jgi:uncharacterized protein